MDVLWEGSIGPFLLIVIVLGGGSAYLAGRAVAIGWQSYLLLAFYVGLLTIAARFLLFGLYERPFLFTSYLFTTYAILLIFGLIGHRIQRTTQMVTQYGWIYRRLGPIFWGSKAH